MSIVLAFETGISAIHSFHKSFKSFFCCNNSIIREIKNASVMSLKHKKRATDAEKALLKMVFSLTISLGEYCYR
jgi:hypothetical protein